MSTESFSPIPVNTFGSLVTLLAPADLPNGLSPDCQDVEYRPGSVRTRAGLLSAFAALAGNPAVNWLKSYITSSLLQRLLVFTSLGQLYKESSPGILSLVTSGLFENGLMSSQTAYGREYMGFSDGIQGRDYPRHFDDTNVDRVSQVGPCEGPSAADSADAGSISAGTHQVVVWYLTRAGYWTRPSPPVTWTAAGSKKVTISNIPVGPPNVVQRLLGFGAMGSSTIYHIPSTMTIQDNTTTTFEVDFDDATLVAATNIEYLFSRIELPQCAGVLSYASRILWWGERAKMDFWRNLSFDAGFSGTRPLGWTLDPTYGAGASVDSSQVSFGYDFKITGDGATQYRGLITQSALAEPWGQSALIGPGTAYSVRARVMKDAGLTQGTLNINIYGTQGVAINTDGLQVTVAQATSEFQEFTAQLTPSQPVLSTDLVLRVFASGTPTSGQAFYVDDIEIYLSSSPTNSSVIRVSDVDDPEGYDGVTGMIEPSEDDGQAIRAMFQLRTFVYIVKERSMYVTADDGTNTPDLWTIEPVTQKIGTPSVQGVDIGDEFAVILARAGLYYFTGGEPVPLSPEIQPTWDAINWECGTTAWVRVDVEHKRILCGVPMGSATAPNTILYCDYTEGFGDPFMMTMMGDIVAAPRARKWSIWNIGANACGLIERDTGQAEIFLGNNAGNGKIYQLTEGQTSDDGAAIDSYYDTAFLSSSQGVGRQLFGFLTAAVDGSGQMIIAASGPGGITTGLLPWTLANPGTEDLERMMSLRAERASFSFGTNAPGSWFSVSKFVAWSKADPWGVVRGHN